MNRTHAGEPATALQAEQPVIWTRGSKRARFPFGDLRVGQSILIRGVDMKDLDRVIASWRKRKGIDLTRNRVFGDVIDEYRVYRRG